MNVEAITMVFLLHPTHLNYSKYTFIINNFIDQVIVQILYMLREDKTKTG